jgi:hypothetical protein
MMAHWFRKAHIAAVAAMALLATSCGGPAAPLRPTPALVVPGLEDVTTLRQSAPQLEVGRDGDVTITYIVTGGDDNRVCVACMPYAQP